MTERYELEDSSGTLLLENGTDNYRLDFPIFTINENVDVTESSNSLKIIIQNIASTVGITEAVNKFKGFVKNISDTIINPEESSVKKLRDNAYLQEGTNDAFLLEDGSGIYIIDYPLKVADETVGVVESSAAIQGLLEVISETIGLTVVAEKVKGFVKNVTQKIVNLEDTINRLLTDVNVYQLEDASGNYLIEDGTGFYELDQLLIIKNASTSTLGLNEASNKLPGILQNIADILQINELSNRLQTIIRTVTLETVGLVESVNRGIRLNVTLETVGIVEASNRLGGLIRNIASTVGFNEASNFVRGLTKNITVETIGLTDALNTVSGIVKEAVDTIGLSEVADRIRTIFISNNLGDFITTLGVTLGIFTSTSSKNTADMTVIDSYNSGDFKIIDDN